MNNIREDIINLLKENARLTNDVIATMLNIDKEIIDKEIHNMENEGIIIKYTTLLNDEKLSNEKVNALIEIRVRPQKRSGFDDLAKEIYKFDEVQSVYLMSGGFDLLVTVEGKNLKEIALFVSEKLSAMNSVLKVSTHFILKKYKTEGIIIDDTTKKNKRIPVTA